MSRLPSHLTPRGEEMARRYHWMPGELTPCGLVHFVVTCGSRYCVSRGERGMVEPQPWWDRMARWRGVVPVWRTWTP